MSSKINKHRRRLRRRGLSRVCFYIGVFLCAMLFFGTISSYLGISYTYTGSLPCGIYRRVDTRIARGCFATFNPKLDAKTAHFLDTYARRGSDNLWMKQIVGVPGDVMSMSPDGYMLVNGVPIPHSKWFPIQSKTGKPYFKHPAYPYTVPPNKYVLLGTHPKSLDSRFYGPIPASIITEINTPILTWP